MTVIMVTIFIISSVKDIVAVEEYLHFVYSSVKQTLRIGRHEIVLKSDSSHINWEQPKVSETSQKNSKNPLGNFIEGNWGCLLVIMIIIFFSIW